MWTSLDNSVGREWLVDGSAVALAAAVTIARPDEAIVDGVPLSPPKANWLARIADAVAAERLTHVSVEERRHTNGSISHGRGDRLQDQALDPTATSYSIVDGLMVCSDAGVAEAATALRSWVLRARHPVNLRYGHALFISQLAALHPCTSDRRGELQPSDFVITVLTSTKFSGRRAAAATTWVTRTRLAGALVLLVSDEDDTATGARALPGATNASYLGAQRRSLLSLQEALRVAPTAKWYWLVDDDTWVRLTPLSCTLR